MRKGHHGEPEADDAPTLGQDASWTHVAERLYDPDRDGELTTAIVLAVADAEGVEPRDLTAPPLFDVIDADGIEQAFFGHGTTETARNGTARVEFRYGTYLVNVRSDGWIHVYEPAEPERA